MLKTRFENAETWTDAQGREWRISDMSTLHLTNLFTMLLMRPERILSMLLHDVENLTYDDHVWDAASRRDRRALKQSVKNVTSMTADELRDYALKSDLGAAVISELETRGVDVDNVRAVCCHT